MILDFYDLQSDPFSNTSNPAWLFASRGHQAALQAFIESLNAGQSLVMLLGEPGVGKTFLLHAALAHSALQHVKTVHVFYPKLSLRDLFTMICRDFGLSAVTPDSTIMAHALHRALLTEHEQGHQVVLVIDEADTIPIEILAALLQLSNFRAFTGEPLLQIVLLGLPGLWQRFRTPPLRPFKQRTLRRVMLAPLTYRESVAYIRHRLLQGSAGAGEGPVFAPEAVRAVARQARGNPRVMNILCTNMLVSGFLARQRPITARIAQDVITAYGEKSSHTRWWGVTAAASLLVVAAMVGLFPSTYQMAFERGSRGLLQLTRSLRAVSGVDAAWHPAEMVSSPAVPELSAPPTPTNATSPTLVWPERPTPSRGSPADRVLPVSSPMPARLPARAPNAYDNGGAPAMPHSAPLSPAWVSPGSVPPSMGTNGGSVHPHPSTTGEEDACILEMIQGNPCPGKPASPQPAPPPLPQAQAPRR